MPEVEEGRPLPNDLDAEAACVSSALLDPKRFDEVAGILESSRFYGPQNRAIWEAITEIRKLGVDVDLATVSRWLRKHGMVPNPVPIAYLAQVVDATPAVDHVMTHAQSVFDCWRLRQLHGEALGAAARIACDRIDDVDCFVGETVQRIEMVGRAPALAGSVWISEGIHQAFTALQERVARGGGLIGESTGLNRLDAASGGLARKRVYVLGARSGMGKTALALNITLNVAAHGLPVQYFSLEMGREELSKRCLSVWSRVSLDPLKHRGGKISPAGWKDLTDAAGAIKRFPILWDDTTGLTVPKLRAKVTQLQAELGRSNRDLFMVVVDHALKLRGTNGKADKRNQMIEITGGIKDMAKDLNVCVLELAQLNRNLESRTVKDKRPRIADLKESGSFEEDADQVWLLHREDKFKRDREHDDGIAEVILAKVRDDGEEGFVKLKWDGPTRRFDNLEDDKFECLGSGDYMREAEGREGE